MCTEDFYLKLTTIKSFLDVTNPQNFVPVPNDWLIIITDIVDSTKAIESGRYKDVNFLGASSIAAVLNSAGNIEIPYVFGGDGASMLIPPSLLEKVQPALRATQTVSKTEFGMTLRVGVVPIAVVKEAGYEIKATKLEISKNYSQGIFIGGGLNYATELVKEAATSKQYQLEEIGASEANFSGLECRWQDIRSKHEEVVSLLVLAMTRNDIENNLVYREVIQKIYEIYGRDDDFHPIAINNLSLTVNSKDLVTETKARSKSNSWLDRWLYLSKIQVENFLGLLLMHFKVKTEEVDWGLYRKAVVAASDYRKFDDMLRMIVAGSTAQREKLTQYLEAQYKEGKLVYGLHVSDRALMTCLVFERNGHHVHFVDGADGGYTQAAKPLKEKLKRKAANWKVYAKLAERRRNINVKKD